MSLIAPASAGPLPPVRFGAAPLELQARFRPVWPKPLFKPLSEADLYALDDAALARYIAAAKKAKAQEHATTAMHMLLFQHEEQMRYRVSLNLPRHLRHHLDTVCDWVIPRVANSMLKLPLKGESVGEFVNYYKAAIYGRVVDFFRTTEGQTIERSGWLPSEHQGEGGPADTLGEELDLDRLLGQIDLEEIVEAALSEFSDDHVAIIRRAFWDDQASKDVAQEFDTTAMNVDTIKSRFRKALREECERRGVTGA